MEQLKLCANGHSAIAFAGGNCPLCESYVRQVGLATRLDETEAENQALRNFLTERQLTYKANP